jgi:regulator of sigma E protease
MHGLIGDLLGWATTGLPAFLFVITVVVFFHELGHFAMARLFGVSVDAFSIGFGRELLGWTDKRGTRWKISVLPLGGYVKFSGDADVSSRPDAAMIEKQRAAAARRHAKTVDGFAYAGPAGTDVGRSDSAALTEFTDVELKNTLHGKPVYQRALVAAAGPVANFILAIVIFTGVFMVTPQPAEPPVIAEITAGSAA